MTKPGLGGAVRAAGATLFARDKAEAISGTIRPAFGAFAGAEASAAREGSRAGYPVPCPVSTDGRPGGNRIRVGRPARGGEGS